MVPAIFLPKMLWIKMLMCKEKCIQTIESLRARLNKMWALPVQGQLQPKKKKKNI